MPSGVTTDTSACRCNPVSVIVPNGGCPNCESRGGHPLFLSRRNGKALWFSCGKTDSKICLELVFDHNVYIYGVSQIKMMVLVG